DLARVQTGAHVQAELLHLPRDRLRAAHAARRAIEGGEVAVARSVDLAPAMAPELTAHNAVELLEVAPPRAIEPAISANITVASTRSGSATCFAPVRNSSISFSTGSTSLVQGRWSSPGNSTMRAPRMRAAM